MKQIENMILKRNCTYVFSDIYHNNRWGNKHSVSGPGSDHIQTSTIRKEISILLKELGIRSLLDAPCGDLYWMDKISLNLDKYIGADIVPELVIKNQYKYGNRSRNFMVLNIIKDNIPNVDMILCRDCLVHLSLTDAISIIKNFKNSESTYILTTTFTRCSKNYDIVATGGWRALNLQLSPFNFPDPIKLINEKCTYGNGRYSDKSLGLWRFEEIQL